jgi:hypothetical protein
MKRDPSGYWKMLGLKGGEGSGENEGHPFRGNQYSEGGASSGGVEASIRWHPSHEMADRMMEKAKLGGFTIDFRTEEPVETGISVGEYPERSGQFNIAEATAEDVQGWLEKNKDILFKEPDKLRVGGWLDEGKIWLDIVRIYDQSERDRAIESGRKANQKAIADLDAIKRGDWDRAFIDTGGTGEAKAASGSGKKSGTYMMFDAKVTAQEIIDALKKHAK